MMGLCSLAPMATGGFLPAQGTMGMPFEAFHCERNHQMVCFQVRSKTQDWPKIWGHRFPTCNEAVEPLAVPFWSPQSHWMAAPAAWGAVVYKGTMVSNINLVSNISLTTDSQFPTKAPAAAPPRTCSQSASRAWGGCPCTLHAAASGVQAARSTIGAVGAPLGACSTTAIVKKKCFNFLFSSLPVNRP